MVVDVDTIWLPLGFIGAALQWPLIAASVQTGRDRLFPRASIRSEQWLINHWNTFLGMFIVGGLVFTYSALADGVPAWILILTLIDCWILYTSWGGKGKAQRYLNSRIPDKFGYFFCERCKEVHRIGDLHV
jgi:hypothetical protein